MYFLFLLLLSAPFTLSSPLDSPIKHFIILMMENRSFDHLLGFLHRDGYPQINGLTGTETNPYSTTEPHSKVEQVNDNGYDTGPDDPLHVWSATAEQIYGKIVKGDEKPTPKMNGFVQNALEARQTPYNVMSMFNSTTAPILNGLATEFAVFDQWYCSVPGPTDPNRAFAMSGTSDGRIDNFNGTLWSQESYFSYLGKHGVSWRAYYQDDPWALMYFRDMHFSSNKKNVFELSQFESDVSKGILANFTWLQPRMTSSRGPPTWQHPDASVSEGEKLIKNIYEILRQSEFWESLAFIITYDEHGGFYDHVPPPQTGIPSPDGITAHNGFKFDRLGIRVPTVLISPWIPKNTVIHEPTKGGPHFDATAIIATCNKFFGIDGSMTKRDAWVGTFEDVFSAETPRTDCPTTLQDLPPHSPEDLKRQHALPLNDHMLIQVEFYCKFNKHGYGCGEGIENQYDASVFIVEEAQKFMSQSISG